MPKRFLDQFSRFTQWTPNTSWTLEKITLDSGILALYAEEYGVETVDEIAPRYARAMVAPTDPRLDMLSKLIYATLLKIGLIHKTRNHNLVRKCHELREFMQETLGIRMGTERMLALAYSSGKFDAFIPIQMGAVLTKVLKRLRAAAWDLVLLRLPARLLAISEEDDGITVGYICTSDRALSQIARTGKLEAVNRLMPNTPEGIPLLSYDSRPLELKIAPALMEQVLEADADWQRARLPYLSETGHHISYEILLTIVAELEQQVAHFCSGT